jgi:uncharacterized coiled-coil protein SlyX
MKKICDGCPWQGLYGDQDGHITTCQYHPISCSLCHQYYKRMEMDAHRDICPQREVSCTYCRHSYPHVKLSQHETTCDHSPTTCECGQVVKRIQLTDHKSDDTIGTCPLTTVSCMLTKFGCHHVIKRGEMTAHMSEYQPQHFNRLTAEVISQHDIIDRLQRTVLALTQRMDEMTSRQIATTPPIAPTTPSIPLTPPIVSRPPTPFPHHQQQYQPHVGNGYYHQQQQYNNGVMHHAQMNGNYVHGITPVFGSPPPPPAHSPQPAQPVPPPAPSLSGYTTPPPNRHVDRIQMQAGYGGMGPSIPPIATTSPYHQGPVTGQPAATPIGSALPLPAAARAPLVGAAQVPSSLTPNRKKICSHDYKCQINPLQDPDHWRQFKHGKIRLCAPAVSDIIL